MQVSVETTSGLERRLTVAIEEARIAQAVESKLKEMAHTVKIKGFRPGKVPLKVVKQQYGGQVREDVVNEVLQSTFYEALSQENLHPAGAPAFSTRESTPGAGLEYTATFEVYPEIQLGSLAEQKIEKPSVEIAETDIDNMIDRIRRQHMSWEVSDAPAANGDQLNIDFKGTIDGEAFDGGEGKGMSIELGSGRMITGFEDGLVGAEKDADIILDLQFPDDYQATGLAGKAVQFAVHVNSVEKAVLPDVDEAFAKKMGVESGDIELLRKDVLENMELELAKQLKTKLKEKVMDMLVDVNKIDIPKSLIENEAEALRNQMVQNLSNQGLSKTDVNALGTDMFVEQAERRVRLGLIMNEIVKENSINVEAENIRALVEEIARPYEQPDEVVKWYYADKRRLSEIESLALEEQVVEWAVEQAEVVETKATFDEIMKPEATA
ncbi:Cell division trigger factor [hydrothermal vent metagenome]|uniref:peptidylprolyl isomerase n=1 Tax=hydrothermal vent metagenome TaxID=652676 RepID=A0A3B1BN08_9ZZZZ